MPPGENRPHATTSQFHPYAKRRPRPLFTDRSPFVNPPKVPERVQWVRPELVCQVVFAEWTDDEQLRQTTFLGWRDDLKPEEIVLEKPGGKL
jgi:bifunctional non-homologous end joining protein LigD